MKDICNKFIQIKFSVRCMVWPSTSLFQPERILKILMRSDNLADSQIQFTSWATQKKC